MLSEFSDRQNIPYHLLSDLDSAVIRQYGILNDSIEPGDVFLYGIPYPGVYMCDEEGVVISKSFHDTYKKRDSADLLLDAALGRVVVNESSPQAKGGDDEVAIHVAVHGGDGSIRQGIVRQLVIRFEPGDGLHLYGEPVPEGMRALTVNASGPPGLVFQEPRFPETESLYLAAMDLTLQVWKGAFEITVPFYPVGELASETRPLDQGSVDISVDIQYQACDDETCRLPKSESFQFELPLDVIDVPNIDVHTGHGQREGAYDGTPHLRRLFLRKLKEHPLGFIRYLFKHVRLMRASKRRAKESNRQMNVHDD